MTFDDQPCAHLRQLLEDADTPTAPPLDDVDYEDETETSDSGGNILRCRSCGHAITKASFRTQKGGRHCHVFCNPSGIVFEIGIFSAAPGAALTGQPSSEFTWFPEHSWRIAVCGSCLVHLGWIWSGPAGMFYGLVLNMLVEDS
ncbi:cereblon family protein [Oceanidesulfovibrio marinus]|uniref:CULT domain-containing protein n=1 Tax=Oceanidesulfovibrio marinus TaxID=370038 RepID=A0A6P1ZJ95_9BACT|nr:cereblon family protein [Oceanidesulfovibrio marinus]QJT09443.1 hypothetical protein E8L03_11045 [Oceanidesulfovibrio marinus]TVM33666.1 hypothetical protein DQK91_10575 [Oceanidesulfovibrio marinus]